MTAPTAGGRTNRTRRAHAGLRLVAGRLGVHDLPVRRVRHERDLRVQMRDGVMLLADRWVPEQAEQAPLVLIRCPYGRRAVIGLAYGRLFAHHGFQVVLQSVRGTAGSGGSFDRPFAAEVEDGIDTVDWLRRQPWYPGSFATAGGSYVGYAQLALAAAAPEEHSAAVLSVTPSTTREIAWPDNTFSPGMVLRWTAEVSDDPAAGLRHMLTSRRLDNKLRAAGRQAPLLDAYRQVTGRAVPFFEEWLSNEDPAATVWKEQDLTSALDVLRGPVLVQAGWYDVFLDGSLRQYAHLRARGVDVRLTVGPWTHVGVALNTTRDTLDFLGEVLLGRPPRAGGKRVRLTDVGDEQEQLLDDWPLRTEERVFHLSAGRLGDAPPAAGAGGVTKWTYDPSDPTPQVGGAVLDATGGGPRDNRGLEERPDVITFDSDPLTTPLQLRGSVRVQLQVHSDRPSTAVFLRLCDVAPDGRSTNLGDRMVALPVDGAPCWVVDAELTATSVVLAAGHRIRLQVSSGAFPRFAPHPGSTELLATVPSRAPAHQTLHHSAERPGIVRIPVAPATP
jgi:putative CocE/NonD family hydrolase